MRTNEGNRQFNDKLADDVCWMILETFVSRFEHGVRRKDVWPRRVAHRWTLSLEGCNAAFVWKHILGGCQAHEDIFWLCGALLKRRRLRKGLHYLVGDVDALFVSMKDHPMQ